MRRVLQPRSLFRFVTGHVMTSHQLSGQGASDQYQDSELDGEIHFDRDQLDRCSNKSTRTKEAQGFIGIHNS